MRLIRLVFVLLLCTYVLSWFSAVQADEASFGLVDVPRQIIQGSQEAVTFGAQGIASGEQLSFQVYDSSTQPWTPVQSFDGTLAAQGDRWRVPSQLAQLEPGTWMLRVFTADQRSEALASIVVASPLQLSGGAVPMPQHEAAPVDEGEFEWEPVDLDEGLDAVDTPQRHDDSQDPLDLTLGRKHNAKTKSNPGQQKKKPVPRTRIGKGFTDYKTAPDSKVVYVPSGGNIREGYDKLRHGYPDHLLLQAGGKYTLSGGLSWGKSGRSKEQPMIFSVVGKGGRPTISCTSGGINFSGTVRNTAFVGLHLTAEDRRPGSSRYRADCPRYDGFGLYASAVNLTIEDCVIEYFTHGVLLEGANDSDIRLHRTIVRHSWSQTSKGHSQGLYGLRVNNLVITDCVFDQNGWEPRASGGARTMFNHNIYVIGTKNLLIDNSIFTRGSSYGVNLRTGSEYGQDQVNVTIRNSLFMDNANTIAAGGKIPKIVSRKLKINDNVFTRHGTVIHGNAQSLGINGFCWDGIEIARNFFIDKPFGGTSFAVKFEPGNGPVRNGKIFGNVVHQWLLSENAIQPSGTNMQASGNYVNEAPSVYADASRNMSTYMKAIGAGGGTASFIEWASNRPRGTWDDRPYKFIDYIKAGFKPKFKK